VDAQPSQPILGFAPSAGGPGTTVSVWGSGYAPNAPVSLRLGFPQPTGDVLSSVFADASGQWQTSLVIPDRLPSGELITRGDLYLVVMDAIDQPLASAPFGFVAGAEPPAPPMGQADWPGADWQILTSGDFNGDGEQEVVYIQPADIQIRTTFDDAYLSSQAHLIRQAMIVQGAGDQARILLAIDAQGIQAEGAPLLSFAASETGPTGFLLALDPGSSTPINLLPLDTAGEHRGQEIGLNWSQAQQSYRFAFPGS
jgi:hypothetical protein